MPTVAILGRPNVGKSTLFNRISKTRKALVHDFPGVTRDRIIEQVIIDTRQFTLIDTGGFDPDPEDVIKRHINRQVELAADMADLVLFVVDGQEGLVGADEEISRLVRTVGKPTILVVNKTERGDDRLTSAEFHNLGFPDLFFISAEHNRNIIPLLERILELLPVSTVDPDQAAREPFCSIAIVGRPNVGKSSLTNRLVGEERVIVSDIAGTTRDSVDTEFTYHKRLYRLIDTAGIRRKSRVKWALEKLSVLMAIKSMERADVVFLVLDASEQISDQDAKIAGLAHDSGRGVVIVVNKWDKIEKNDHTATEFERNIRDMFKFLAHAPIVFVSCETGQRLHRPLDLATEMREAMDQKVGTGHFNRILDQAHEGMQPPMIKGRRLKMYYATQVSTRPPTFVIFCNDPQLVHFSYERYLINQIRTHFPFSGQPIRLLWRGKEAWRKAEKKLGE